MELSICVVWDNTSPPW